MDPRTLRDEKLSVYGDALLGEGRQQGTLIHLQLARHRNPFARRALAQKQSEDELIAAHRDELFGPLAGNTTLKASWCLGFISNLSIELDGDDELEALEEALTLPTFARLERLSLRGVFSDLSFLEKTKLQHLVLDGQAELGTLPAIRFLTLSGDASVDFSELTLEGTEVLRLAVGFAGLSAESAPKLRVLSVTDELPEELELPPKVRLLHLDGSFYGELPEVDAPRIIHEAEWGEDENDERVISRCGTGRHGERALVITSARESDCRALISRLDAAKNLSAAVSTFEFACHAFTAIELRMENASNGALLRKTSESLAKSGQRVIEFATSASNHECIAWAVDASRVRPLAMGPAKDRRALWQLAIDRGFGFDPGDTLEELFLELDASEHLVLGDEAATGQEWPLVTTFTPRERDWDWDYDGYDEDEAPPPAGETNFDPMDFRDQSAPTNWWRTEVVEEATHVESEPEVEEEAEEVEAPPADATSEDWDEVLAESPVDLESDGGERNPEYGLEPDFFDPDSVSSAALIEDESGDPVQCECCEARSNSLRACRVCSRKVCAKCTEVPAGADGEVLCRTCPRPRPVKAPEPSAYSEEEDEEES